MLQRSVLGNLEIVNLLLSQPKILVDSGIVQAPLHAAVIGGHYHVIQMLIAAGCDVNKVIICEKI